MRITEGKLVATAQECRRFLDSRPTLFAVILMSAAVREIDFALAVLAELTQLGASIAKFPTAEWRMIVPLALLQRARWAALRVVRAGEGCCIRAIRHNLRALDEIVVIHLDDRPMVAAEWYAIRTGISLVLPLRKAA